MTEEDRESRMKHLDILLFVGLLILFFAGLQFGASLLFGGNEEEIYDVGCHEYDGEIIKEKWILKDNITSYEDIPESEKENLSNASIEILKRSDSRFRGINYTNMSDIQKEVFRRAINDSLSVNEVDSRSKTPDTRVIYRGEVYFCETVRTPQGA